MSYAVKHTAAWQPEDEQVHVWTDITFASAEDAQEFIDRNVELMPLAKGEKLEVVELEEVN